MRKLTVVVAVFSLLSVSSSLAADKSVEISKDTLPKETEIWVMSYR
jgi:hypothetical protein